MRVSVVVVRVRVRSVAGTGWRVGGMKSVVVVVVR